jgi:Ca2+-binding EF-hand superfamily protein
VVNAQVDAMLDRYDQNDDGDISFREFVSLFEEQLA